MNKKVRCSQDYNRDKKMKETNLFKDSNIDDKMPSTANQKFRQRLKNTTTTTTATDDDDDYGDEWRRVRVWERGRRTDVSMREGQVRERKREKERWVGWLLRIESKIELGINQIQYVSLNN